MTTELLAPYRWLYGDDCPLGDIYAVAFVRGLGPAEVLRRFDPAGAPGREMTFDELDTEVGEFVMETKGGSGGGYVGVVEAGGWCVAVELWGWSSAVGEAVSALSRGGELVAVSRHDYADDHFVHALDGAVVTEFDPNVPHYRYGTDAHRLDGLMREVGMRLDGPDDEPDDDGPGDDELVDGRYDPSLARAFALAARITGVPFAPELLDGPLLVGQVAKGWAGAGEV
ncbi:DUF6461 domain-containing protein [Nonomuraea sp. NPDC050783]|uniref:DUF6461 domain-containing protein n=1 Tax=Nonomuraea sp. NPDC050783 TaxID=3154634 RepID=UPI003466D435